MRALREKWAMPFLLSAQSLHWELHSQHSTCAGLSSSAEVLALVFDMQHS